MDINRLAFESGILEERVRTLRELVKRLVDACETTNKQKDVEVQHLIPEAKRIYEGTDLANISERRSVLDSTTKSE